MLPKAAWDFRPSSLSLPHGRFQYMIIFSVIELGVPVKDEIGLKTGSGYNKDSSFFVDSFKIL